MSNFHFSSQIRFFFLFLLLFSSCCCLLFGVGWFGTYLSILILVFSNERPFYFGYFSLFISQFIFGLVLILRYAPSLRCISNSHSIQFVSIHFVSRFGWFSETMAQTKANGSIRLGEDRKCGNISVILRERQTEKEETERNSRFNVFNTCTHVVYIKCAPPNPLADPRQCASVTYTTICTSFAVSIRK